MTTPTILFVDDEPLIRQTVCRDLNDQGYAAVSIENGEKALMMLQQRHYDLVITDMMMEGVDGIQVLREAKRINPETMVMVMTGYGSLTSAIDALRLGAADYLLKPCNRQELRIRVANCIEKQVLQRKIKLYEDILPMCGFCKRMIRDDSGKESGTGVWMPVDEYIVTKAHVHVSHGVCPACYKAQISEE